MKPPASGFAKRPRGREAKLTPLKIEPKGNNPTPKEKLAANRFRGELASGKTS